MPSLQGYLLVASPHLAGSEFSRSVILVLQHNEQGAIGVVLNRPMNETIQKLWQHISGQPCPSNRWVNIGGPMSGPLMALHDTQALGELSMPNGLYVAASKPQLEQLVKQTEHPFRIFVGHAGWGGGQLEDELQAGAWLLLRAEPEHVFADFDDLWVATLKEIGRNVLSHAPGVRGFPSDPSVN